MYSNRIKIYIRKEDFDYVIPMDGDGEDRPEEINNFLNQNLKSNNSAMWVKE